MRYESAMKVVRCLRGSLGEPLSILAICSRIDLSYQPTYRHVRELEAAGVLVAERVGREVLCRLAASEAAALWLSLASAEDAERALTDGRDRLASELLSAARAGRLGEVLGLALFPRDGRRELLALVPSGADTRPHLSRISALCGALKAADVQPVVLNRDQFMRRLMQEWTPVRFAEQALVLWGREMLWQAVLAAAPVKPPVAKAGRRPVAQRRRRQPRKQVQPSWPQSPVDTLEERFID